MFFNERIVHWQGSSRQIRITVDVSLVGASAWWWMGKNAESEGSDIFVQKDSDGNGITFEGSVIVIQLDPSDTQDITAGSWYHECKLLSGVTSEIFTAALGEFLLMRSLVRV